MKKKINLKYLFLIIIFCCPVLFVNSASVYIDPTIKNINEGDVGILVVKINSENSTINVVEGEIILNDSSEVLIRDISLADSSFIAWAKEPVLSSDKKTISFVAGVPGGINSSNATLFKIIFEAKKTGQIKISPKNIIAYINDGKGTKAPISITGSVISISSKINNEPKDEWKSLVYSDKQPPEDFVIEIGQDSSMFGGKKIAVFTAVDKETGIDYYEVFEDGNESVRSENIYVLKNQDDDINLRVLAYDKAGNKKESNYPQKPSNKKLNINLIVLISILVVIIAIYYVKKYFIKK